MSTPEEKRAVFIRKISDIIAVIEERGRLPKLAIAYGKLTAVRTILANIPPEHQHLVNLSVMAIIAEAVTLVDDSPPTATLADGETPL